MFIVCHILFWTASPVPAADDLSQWHYYKGIRVQGDHRYQAVMLDEEIYRNALPRLGDLRIVDDRGGFVPYYVENSYSYENRDKVVYGSTQIDTFNERNFSVVDFKVTPLKDNADILGNSLALSIPDRNFAKNVEVYGSYDGVEWQFVTSSGIYKVDNLERTEVALNNLLKYRFYRVKIPNNLENIHIDRLQVVYENIRKERNSFLKRTELTYEIKNEDKITVITVRNANHLKIGRIYLNAEEGNFNRHFDVMVKTGDQVTDSVRSGEIYNLRFKDLNLSNTAIDFGIRPVSGETLQIRIMNKDDRPLNIKGITADYYLDKLVFEAVKGAGYSLYYGNPGAVKPSYDMETYREHIEKENQDSCSLAQAVEVKAGAPLKKQGMIDFKIIFNGVIAAVAILLILLIGRKLNLRSR